MKFNLNIIIDEEVNEYPHGVEVFKSILLECDNTSNEVSIHQGKDYINMSEQQAIKLYEALKVVLGDNED